MPARPGSVPITLVLGEEDLLAERVVAEAVAAAIERLGPGTSVEEVRAGALPDGFAMGLATPSLFGGGRQGRFFKEVQRQAATVLVARLKPSERASWLRAEVRRLGRKADEAAVAALLDTVGQDLRELAGAGEKLHVAGPPPAGAAARPRAEFLRHNARPGGFPPTDP